MPLLEKVLSCNSNEKKVCRLYITIVPPPQKKEWIGTTLTGHYTISEAKISKAISKLKKISPGVDGILNEYIIEFKSMISPILEKLFNAILLTGHYPTAWTESLLIPIHKKALGMIPLIIEV